MLAGWQPTGRYAESECSFSVTPSGWARIKDQSATDGLQLNGASFSVRSKRLHFNESDASPPRQPRACGAVPPRIERYGSA